MAAGEHGAVIHCCGPGALPRARRTGCACVAGAGRAATRYATHTKVQSGTGLDSACCGQAPGAIRAMAPRVWWVSVVTVLAVPTLIGAKDAGPGARGGARRTSTRLVRTHPLSEAGGFAGNRPRTDHAGGSSDPYAEWDPVSEAIWGSLVTHAPRPRRGAERTFPAPARGADVIDGCGKADFPLCSPPPRGMRRRISLRDSQAQDRRDGSPYDGILERMRADREHLARLEAAASAAPSARLDPTAVVEEAPWFGSARAAQRQHRCFFTRSTADSRDVTPVCEDAPVAKELRDEALAPAAHADAEQAAAPPASLHTRPSTAPEPEVQRRGRSSQPTSSASFLHTRPSATAPEAEASSFPGHQSGMVEWA